MVRKQGMLRCAGLELNHRTWDRGANCIFLISEPDLRRLYKEVADWDFMSHLWNGKRNF